MSAVGVRELKARASEILRRVREDGEIVEITYRGRVVARLVPAEPTSADIDETRAVLTDLQRLAEEIGTKWPAGVSAVDAVREQRREL
jgi:prevent-host-death family protein